MSDLPSKVAVNFIYLQIIHKCNIITPMIPKSLIKTAPVWLIAAISFHSISFAQITNLDGWERRHIDKAPPIREDNPSVCYHKGFELSRKSPELINIQLGEKRTNLQKLLSEKGFKSMRVVGSGSGGIIRPSPYKCGQSGYSIIEYCRLIKEAETEIIQSTRAKFSEVAVSDNCLYGLANKLEFKEYEKYEVSKKRPINEGAFKFLRLNRNMSLPYVDKQLLTNGWQNDTSEFLMNRKAQSCENNDDGWVLTAKRDYTKVIYDNKPIIQKIRVYFSADCSDYNMVDIGRLRKILVVPN